MPQRLPGGHGGPPEQVDHRVMALLVDLDGPLDRPPPIGGRQATLEQPQLVGHHQQGGAGSRDAGGLLEHRRVQRGVVLVGAHAMPVGQVGQQDVEGGVRQAQGGHVHPRQPDRPGEAGGGEVPAGPGERGRIDVAAERQRRPAAGEPLDEEGPGPAHEVQDPVASPRPGHVHDRRRDRGVQRPRQVVDPPGARRQWARRQPRQQVPSGGRPADPEEQLPALRVVRQAGAPRQLLTQPAERGRLLAWGAEAERRERTGWMQRPCHLDLVEEGGVSQQGAGPATRDGDEEIGGHRDPQPQQRGERARVAEAEGGGVIVRDQLGLPAERSPDLVDEQGLQPGQHLTLDHHPSHSGSCRQPSTRG